MKKRTIYKYLCWHCDRFADRKIFSLRPLATCPACGSSIELEAVWTETIYQTFGFKELFWELLRAAWLHCFYKPLLMPFRLWQMLRKTATKIGPLPAQSVVVIKFGLHWDPYLTNRIVGPFRF